MPNSYTRLLYHIVCGTKDRRPLISNDWRGELDRYIGGLVREKGGELLEIGGMPDHIHLAIRARPDVSPSGLDVLHQGKLVSLDSREGILTWIWLAGWLWGLQRQSITNAGCNRLHPCPTGASQN